MSLLKRLFGRALAALPDFASGSLIATILPRIYNLHPHLWLYPLGMALAVFPDSDMPLQKKLEGKIDSNHRSYIPHRPAIYAIISFVIAFFSGYAAVFFAACLFLHLFHDSFGSGFNIPWLWPFVDKRKRIQFLYRDKDQRLHWIKVWTPPEIAANEVGEPTDLEEFVDQIWLKPSKERTACLSYVLLMAIIILAIIHWSP